MAEHNGTKVLFDPWLLGKTQYGSWSIYPELNIDWSEFDDLDYIHISHVHADHLHVETLNKISNEIPILIHKWDDKFVKNILERIGKRVIELEHGEAFKISEDLEIYVYAADGCDPESCFKFLGCGKKSKPNASIGIDTFSLLRTKQHNFLQINDCPFPLMQNTLQSVLDKFGVIDLLFLSYTGAGSYPQCWSHYSTLEKEHFGKVKRSKFIDWGIKTLKFVQPKYYMPYAGEYTLSGFLSSLEKYKFTPSKEEALEIYKSAYKEGTGFCLNQKQYFDIQTLTTSAPYVPIDVERKEKYINNVLSKIKFPYEYDDEVTLEMILKLLPEAFKRYCRKRKELRFETETKIFIYLIENKVLKIHNNSELYEVVSEEEIANCNRFVTYRMHPKLLLRVLKGPKYAHINNAEIGSHIEFTRKPEIYERKLYYSMNYFHG